MKGNKGVVAALAAALCFGAIPAIVKAADAGGASVLTLLSVRYVLASAVLVPAALLRHRKALPPLRQLWKIMAAAGVFLGLEAALYFTSLTMLPSSLAALVLFTYPLIVNVLGLIRGGRIAAGGWAAMVLCLAGLAALLGPDFAGLSIIGLLLAFFAAVSYSIYLLIVSRLTADVDPFITNAAVSAANTVTMTAAAFATGTFYLAFQPEAWVSIGLLVLVSNLAGFQLFFIALKKLGPDRTSMLNMAEPLFTVLIGVMLLGEQLSLLQAAGAASVICGLVVFEYVKLRGTTKNPCQTGGNAANGL